VKPPEKQLGISDASMIRPLEPDRNHPFLEPFLVFLKLGMTSFGGPIAHLGYFHKEIVSIRKWLSEKDYADIVALCQFLPGPASSQVGFAIGHIRGGIPGAFGAWAGFTLPSTLIMLGFASGMAYLDAGHGWIRGLKIAALAVVAHAVWTMARKLCPGAVHLTGALISATIVLLAGTALSQVMVIAVAMLLSWAAYKAISKNSTPANPLPADAPDPTNGTRASWLWLALFAVGMGAFMLLDATSSSRWISMGNEFYRTGSLVFGGGHVVLPLLETATVGRGWLDQDTFLAGYGAAQALPGPLFTFAAYLGSIVQPNGPGWLAGLFCLLAILTPSFLLVLGAMPHWQKLRLRPDAQAALTGANVAVVGILLAALIHPVFSSAVSDAKTLIFASAAYVLLQFGKCPAIVLVGMCAGAGGFLL